MVDRKFYKHLGPVSLIELIDGLDVDIPEGSFGDIQISTAAPYNQAGAATLTYVHGKSAAQLVRACKAEVCLMTADVASSLEDNSTVLPLVTNYPQANFARILDRLYIPQQISKVSTDDYPQVTIGPRVFIGSGAEIGKGTTIGPNTVIGTGVVIGENCTIGANVVIEFAYIGNACNIVHGAVIGGTGFGVAMSSKGGVDIPHVGTVYIGDRVTIGANTTIDRSMFGPTKIGEGTKIDNLVQIAHNVELGENCMLAGQVGIAGSCKVGNGVMMGGQAGVADHIIIGDGAVLSGGSSTMHNIPPGEIWSGIPAMPVRQHMRQIGAIRKLVAKKTKKST